MIIDALRLLSLSGFPIDDYQYTGVGSVFFVDFILFHKFLGITDMVNAEHSDIPNRVAFNQPYDFIRTEFSPIGDLIPTLSPDKKHLLWLDYDDILQRAHIEDILLATTYLTPGSLLLVTVDVEPPGKGEGPKQWRDYFVSIADSYLMSTEIENFKKSNLPKINAGIIARAIRDGLAPRTNVRFFPLFNFLYADGHRMLCLGGMVGTDVERRYLRGSKVYKVDYIRRDLEGEPFRIRVPIVTRKERLYLDSHMPCPADFSPSEFELPADDIASYREIYRFFPAYAELLL
jgi:hypothetical protein